jgi:hypothetical protein
VRKSELWISNAEDNDFSSILTPHESVNSYTINVHVTNYFCGSVNCKVRQVTGPESLPLAYRFVHQKPVSTWGYKLLQGSVLKAAARCTTRKRTCFARYFVIRYNYKAASRTIHVASIYGTLRQFKFKWITSCKSKNFNQLSTTSAFTSRQQIQKRRIGERQLVFGSRNLIYSQARHVAPARLPL